MNWEATVWLGLTLAFLIVEGVCAFHLVSIWFAAGSLIAMVTALLGGPLWLQGVLFLTVSCALLALMIPLVKKLLRPKLENTNVDAIIGSQGYVTDAIDNLDAVGQVKLGGMYWTARSDDGKPIDKGTLVQVCRIEGVKVFVTPVREAAEIKSVR